MDLAFSILLEILSTVSAHFLVFPTIGSPVDSICRNSTLYCITSACCLYLCSSLMPTSAMVLSGSRFKKLLAFSRQKYSSCSTPPNEPFLLLIARNLNFWVLYSLYLLLTLLLRQWLTLTSTCTLIYETTAGNFPK